MSHDVAVKTLTGPRLVISHPDGETLYPLLRPDTVLGRLDSADVVLTHPSVSRVHARVTLQGSTHHVRDLGSSSGTFVNGERIREAGSSLSNGDTINIGAVTIRYER